jgi:hypothetical protein
VNVPLAAAPVGAAVVPGAAARGEAVADRGTSRDEAFGVLAGRPACASIGVTLNVTSQITPTIVAAIAPSARLISELECLRVDLRQTDAELIERTSDLLRQSDRTADEDLALGDVRNECAQVVR